MPNSNDEYQVYLLNQSYYSGKLHSYMRYKNIPLQTHQINILDWWREGYCQTGLMKIPYAQSPDGQWLQDSTPMRLWLEERYPEHSVKFH